MSIVLTWLLKNWKLVLGAAVAIAIVWWFSHARYSAGEAAGRAAVQKLWDAENSAELQAAMDAADRATEIEAERVRIAKEIQDGLQAKLDSATADARTLSERLRHYQARRCPSAVPQASGPATVADSPTGVAADSGAVGEATDAHFAACARDAERLAGWQGWYKGLSEER